MANGLEVARMFHEAYERLAPSFGYETRADTKAFDPNSPNGKLMAAVCQKVAEQIERESFRAGYKAAIHDRGLGPQDDRF